MGTVLLVAALLPAVALMVYVYTRDKVEREPAGLVVRMFFLGAASGIVAGIAESILIGGVEAVLPAGPLLIFVEYFICVAAVEELCKFTCLNTVKKNPAFDYVFDAIVYSVAAALGFAALENVFYVFDGGLETAALRAVLSVPGHAADGVVMGVFYGMARRRELRGNKAGARTYYILSVLLPTIEHGFYDAALSLESDLMALVAMLFDLAFIALAFVLVKKIAAKDAPLHPTQAGAQQGAGMPMGAPQPPTQAGFQQGVGMPMSAPLPPNGSSAPANTPGPSQAASSWVAGPSQSASAPAPESWVCPHCASVCTGNFCGNCGNPRPR